MMRRHRVRLLLSCLRTIPGVTLRNRKTPNSRPHPRSVRYKARLVPDRARSVWGNQLSNDYHKRASMHMHTRLYIEGLCVRAGGPRVGVAGLAQPQRIERLENVQGAERLLDKVQTFDSRESSCSKVREWEGTFAVVALRSCGSCVDRYLMSASEDRQHRGNVCIGSQSSIFCHHLITGSRSINRSRS